MKWIKLFSNNIANAEWVNLDMCQTISFLKSNGNDPNWEQDGKLYEMLKKSENPVKRTIHLRVISPEKPVYL